MLSRRFTRPVDGILLLDKHSHITSNDILQKIKRLFAAKKAGHTGSLDPLASGMLPICFGEATKFSQFLLEADKRYYVIAKLGVTTTTGDREGEIVHQVVVPPIIEAKLTATLRSFCGDIQQVPSMYSALKHKGRPLYELARQGIVVERPARPVTIHELKLLSSSYDTLTLEVACTKGTYIRTLVEDIGNALGCGAHVIELRRLTAGAYQENQMVSFATLEALAEKGDFSLLDTYLLPVDTAVQHWPRVNISDATAYYLLRGQPVVVPRLPAKGWVRLFLNPDKFLGVGEIQSDGRVAPRRLVQEAK